MTVFRQFANSLAFGPFRLKAKFDQRRKARFCVLGRDTVLLATAAIENPRRDAAAIAIGRDSRIAGRLAVFGHGGRISLGDHCFVGEGTRIWSANSITIGDRVLVSHGVNIHDTNAHSLSAASRHSHIMEIFHAGHPSALPDVPDRAITIEDDVWIGFNATVLKGVTIGRGAVIGATTLITHDVPPFSVMVGNPARCIGAALP